MNCPNCGSQDENKRYCTRCGTNLVEFQTQAAPAPNIAMGRAYAASPQQPPPTNALTSRTLDERYYLDAKLGEGGMGTVYRARRLLIGDTVAVKVLHPGQVADPNAVERFRREAQAAARIKHPNVVSVYDFAVSSEGLVYLVMELVEGESLRQVIQQQGKLSAATATEVARQVCAALDEARQQNVVHRDIKPENILVQSTTSGLRVKVLDFGVAALLDVAASRLTLTGNVIGTLHYMSPEQCLGEEPDARSDIYSFGIVLYEMLTGVVPFDSPTATAIVIQHVNQPPPPMRGLNPEITAEVEAVVLHALQKQRGARPNTAGDLARELEAALKGIAPAPVRAFAPAASVASPGDREDEPMFSLAGPAAKRNGKLMPLLFAMFFMLALGGGTAYFWTLKKVDPQPSAPTGNTPAINQQPATIAPAQSPPATPESAAQTITPPSSDPLWELIPDQTIATREAENALGAPDRQVAVVAPGGQIALAYLEGRFFGDGTGADLRVSGSAESPVSYAIFVRDRPAGPWRRIDINRRGFPQGEAGHDMGHHGVNQARQVMIRNDAETDLQLDAIRVVYKDSVAPRKAAPHSHPRHNKRR